MAIGTDDAIDKFGTDDDLDSTSAAVTNTSFSVAGDLAQWTNDDDAPFARFILESTFSVSPDANSVVELFARLIDFNVGNDDTEVPTANFPHKLLGAFAIKDQTAIQRSAPLFCRLPNYDTSQVYEFYIRVQTGQTVSAGWTIFVKPITGGPHA